MDMTLQDWSDTRELGSLGDAAWQAEPFMNVETAAIPTVAEPIATETISVSTEPPSYDEIRPAMTDLARLDVEEAFLEMQRRADANLL